MIFKKDSVKTISIVTAFSIAMAFVEAAAIIYLREIFYPAGFNFPLNITNASLLLTIEWIREFFTIVMLACIGLFAGKKLLGKFAYFVYSFAVWDIFYYIWLKLSINWPASLFTWDLLFLIPFFWIGPVLAPIIVSSTLILFFFVIINLQDKEYKLKLRLTEALLFILGCFVILYTFLYDYTKLIIQGGFIPDLFNLAANPEFINIVNNYAPSSYNWLVFAAGEILMLLSIFIFYFRNKKSREKK